MFHKGNLVALGIQAEMAYPPLALVNNVSNGIFDPVAALGMMNHRKLALCIPVGPGNIFQHFAWRTAGQRSASQSALAYFQVSQMISVEHHGKLSRA